WSTQRLAEELQGGPLSFARATRIARTETGFAFNEGAAKVFEVAGQDLVDVLDGDGCLPGGHNDAAVASSQTPGQVEPDKLADGQVWTIAQMRAYLLGHPHCVRAFVAHEA
ncbi:MAG TPA: hypothetical protein VFG76_06910, partial [Candidatus Polarisedimenticolia bacterium]|nr:hypothetical protein [Candidatus Polarisedimenticolia bacterium]